MILSNEPGYYKTDGFGIRIENLELVVGADIAGAEKPVNAFETLTLAPIDRRLIDLNMLSATRAELAQRLSRPGAPRGPPPCSTKPPKCGSTPPPRRCRFRRTKSLACRGERAEQGAAPMTAVVTRLDRVTAASRFHH